MRASISSTGARYPVLLVPGSKRGSASRFRRASLSETRSLPSRLTRSGENSQSGESRERAACRARAGRARPAAPPQDPGLQQSGLARMKRDVLPVVARGQDVVGAAVIVPSPVAGALLVRMGQPAVELDGEPVLLVVDVAVGSLAVD